MTGLLIFLLFLTSYRLTRIITRDKLPFIAVPREAFVQRWGAYDGVDRVRDADAPRRWWLVCAWKWLWASEFPAIGGRQTNMVMKSAAYLWECDWCMGVWTSGAAVYGVYTAYDLPYPVLVWGAAAAVTGLLTQFETLMDKKAN